MKKIGITGGIGSGKSVACKIFSMLGVPIYNSDDRAKRLMNSDSELKHSISQSFGENSYDSKGMLNRVYMANTVFKDQSKLSQLNSLVHPAVSKDFDQWCDDQNSVFVIKEAALLIETGIYKSLDALITVLAPKEVRLHRVLMRDEHRDEQQVLAIMEKQCGENTRKKIADFHIYNNDNELIIPQILNIHKSLSKK